MKKIFRARDGQIFGVAKGLADWAELPVEYIRIGLIISCVFTGFFPVGFAYVMAGLFLPLTPSTRHRFQDEDDHHAFGFCRTPRDAFHDMKKDFQNLKGRVKNMEHSFYDRERDWEERFKRTGYKDEQTG